MSFGQFDRSADAPPMSDINMTPLIDVMLVLLVIFIITAPLLLSAIRLDLPKTDAAKARHVPQSITVVVDVSGQTFLQDRPITLPDLVRQLAAVQQANPDTEVQLRADRAVPYGRIVEVMGAAQQAGLNRLGFVADALASPPPGLVGATPVGKP